MELRALPGRRGEAAPVPREAGGGGRSSDGARPSQGALAGFHDLLRHVRHCRRDRSAEEVLRAGRGGRIQAEAGRRGPLQVREPASRHRHRARSIPRVLAARALRQAADAQGGARQHDAEAVKHDPRLGLSCSRHASIFWVEFADQWDPKSPWSDKRLRLAVNYALDRKGTNEAACLGCCPPAGCIVPRVMDFALQAQPLPYDPGKAKQLLAEAGYPNGFDAGEFTPIPGFPSVGDAVLNNLNAVGIRVRARPMERAAFYAAWQEKKLRGLFLVGVGNSGNAATRVEAFIYSKGGSAYGGYPDLDEMFLQQARERDPAKREAILHRIQQATIDRVMFAPLMDLRTLNGTGPRLADHTMNAIPLYPFPAYEDIRLKNP